MTRNESEQVRRETFEAAIAIVQKYQNDHWRRLRVNEICSEIACLLKKEQLATFETVDKV
jgi:hypothetical protein